MHPRLDPKSIVYDQVHNERVRAHAKHGANGNSRENAKWTDKEWLPILMEEIGEVAHCLTYDAWPPAGSTQSAEIRKELVQVAAMAIAWIESIDDV